MTVEEAIQHCKETALSNAACGTAYRKGGQTMLADGCEACAAEHAQLAEWLEELLRRREEMAVQRGQSARLEEALLQARKRIRELEEPTREALAKRAEAYDKLCDLHAKIDELLKRQAK